MEQIPCGEADSRTVSQEISHLLLKVHPILRQMNPV